MGSYKPEEVFVSDGKINLDDDDFDELIQNNDVNLMQSTGKMDSTGTVIGNIYENPELMEATND
ncbi:TPA: YopX family protein [Streptococcus suis]